MPFGDRRSRAERRKLGLDELKAHLAQGAAKALDALVEFHGGFHHLGRGEHCGRRDQAAGRALDDPQGNKGLDIAADDLGWRADGFVERRVGHRQTALVRADAVQPGIAVVAEQVLAVGAPDGGEDQQGEDIAAMQLGERTERREDLEGAGAEHGAPIVGCCVHGRPPRIAFAERPMRTGGALVNRPGQSPKEKPAERIEVTICTTLS
uniref:Transposase n=1 Tax=Parastrongyloides trichosuri TaxID=131310 RepID=A0A0N4ZLI7_PARTI